MDMTTRTTAERRDEMIKIEKRPHPAEPQPGDHALWPMLWTPAHAEHLGLPTVDGQSIKARPVRLTRARCREIVATLEGQGAHMCRQVRRIRIDMSWTRVARYDVERDTLQIWSDGLPVYEDDAGQVCEDPVALADCLC
jgi:hypothetical protein